MIVEPFLAAGLAALFDDGLPAPQPGEPLPAYWHLAACATPAASRDLGADGHPRTGILVPPADLPRRMFAGGSLHIDRPLVVGERVEHSAAVVDTSDRQGRSGPLRFVTVEHTFSRAEGAAQVERQQIVYRAPTESLAAAPGQPRHSTQERLLTPGPGAMRAQLCADPVALQRFSALTSNAHRIHYDYPWATGVEGYPDLVVHGPLLLLALLELLRLDDPHRQVTDVEFTASAPVFCGEEVELTGTPDGDRVVLCARSRGQVAMTATAALGFPK
ncbi:MAG TPA: MaoC family dehydratase N-terminal domain-containing protein [Mycobacteriales bacterium]|nr:MaoC family dehydratase N-terminal domain-containing protein [Mycobacteriales bacterium]HWA68019.1 MaoC family dehydratase N-terminal domain-containing protein [Mycobacteriales bacterium]